MNYRVKKIENAYKWKNDCLWNESENKDRTMEVDEIM